MHIYVYIYMYIVYVFVCVPVQSLDGTAYDFMKPCAGQDIFAIISPFFLRVCRSTPKMPG